MFMFSIPRKINHLAISDELNYNMLNQHKNKNGKLRQLYTLLKKMFRAKITFN